jgi:hypothetical protein
MIRVIVESPYAGETSEEIERNVKYARAAMHDCLLHGESPYASHLLYTQPGVLRDHDPEERKLGIAAGFAWREVATKSVVYTDLGVTKGMQAGIDHALSMGHEIEFRRLQNWEE